MGSDAKYDMYNELDRAYPTQKVMHCNRVDLSWILLGSNSKRTHFCQKKSDLSRFSQSIESSCEKELSF